LARRTTKEAMSRARAVRVGLPLHLIGADGSVVRSYGVDRGSFCADIDFIDSRSIAPAGGDGHGRPTATGTSSSSGIAGGGK